MSGFKHNGICIADKHGEWVISGYPAPLTETQREEIAHAFDKVKELEKKLVLAESEWKTYFTMSEELSKKLAEANKEIGLINNEVKYLEEQIDSFMDEPDIAIKALQTRLALAVEALEFYANLDSWTSNDDSCGKTEIRCIDEESCLYREDYEDDNESGTEIFGGKRARAALKQLAE